MKTILIFVIFLCFISCTTYHAIECPSFSNKPVKKDLNYLISQIKIPKQINHRIANHNVRVSDNIIIQKVNTIEKINRKETSQINIRNQSLMPLKMEKMIYSDTIQDRKVKLNSKYQNTTIQDTTKIKKDIKTAKVLTSISVPLSLIGVGLGLLTGAFILVAGISLISIIFCIYSIIIFKKHKTKMTDYKKWITLTYIFLILNTLIGIFGSLIIYVIASFSDSGISMSI